MKGKELTAVGLGVGAALLMMVFTSAVVLLGVSYLTEKLDWYAKEAMAGITVTYAVSGMTGGMVYGSLVHRHKKRLYHPKQTSILTCIGMGVCLGSLYMGVLLAVSMVQLSQLKDAAFETERLFPVWMLVVCCTVFGLLLLNMRKPQK